MQEVRVVTFAVGEAFEQMAALTMPRAEKVLGLPIEVIKDGKPEDTFTRKMKLLQEAPGPVLCIDVDMVFCSWDWSSLKQEEFNAVLDHGLETWAGGNLAKIGVDAGTSVNGGLWLANAKHVQVFELAERLMNGALNDYFLKMGDQTSLNKALQTLETPVHVLPRDFNYLVPPGAKLRDVPRSARVVHLVGNSVGPNEIYLPWKKLQRVKEALDAFPPR